MKKSRYSPIASTAVSTDATDTLSSSSSTHVVPPSQFLCPLTMEVMKDPVNDEDGHTYEKKAILGWLKGNHICPISRKPLQATALTRNTELHRRIQVWQQQQQQQSSSTTSSVREFETIDLMLLPQERHALQIIRHRVLERKESNRRNAILAALMGVATGILIIALTLYLARDRVSESEEEQLYHGGESYFGDDDDMDGDYP